MSRSLQAYDDIAIAELIFYSVALIGSVFLCIKHGFVKSAGWRSLLILSLARIVGGSLRLATISDPNNSDLYIGWMTVNGIGLAPLILIVVGLLSRVFKSINRQGRVAIEAKYLHYIELLMLLAVILLVVGGTKSSFTVVDGKPKVDYSAVSKAAEGILIAVAALLALGIVIAFKNRGYLSQGEHRIVFAVAACFPLIVVRLTYSCLLVLGGLTSTPWLYLGLSSIMEMIVTVVMEGMGFTLDKATPAPTPRDEEMQSFRK